MAPSLTLHVPFILLGRRNILDASDPSINPINIIHQTLQQFCPTISVQPWARDTDPEHTAPHEEPPKHKGEQDWEDANAESDTWLLRPAPCSTPFPSNHDAPLGWRNDDAQLTPTETSKLGEGTWSYPILLQRRGVPADTASPAWRRFVCETHELLDVLGRAFTRFEGPVQGVSGSARYWDLGAGEKCFLRVVGTGVDAETGKKVGMLVAAFERELDLLRTTGEVVGFVGVGRWLEGVLLRRVGREKRDAWRRLREVQVGVEGGKWESSVGREEERYARTKGRGREWWDVVHDMDAVKIVKEMQRAEARGMRLGVSVKTAPGGPTQIIFQGQRSTLESGYLLAYTELLARIVHTAHRNDTDDLAEKLEDLCLCPPTTLHDRFSNMLDFISQHDAEWTPDSKPALLAHISLFTTPLTATQSLLAPSNPRQTRAQRAADPFYSLRTYMASRYLCSREDMKLFMDRYERAGGYMPTKERKLVKMVSVEEEKHGRMRSGEH